VIRHSGAYLTAGNMAGHRIEYDEILNVGEVFKLLKLHPRTVYRLAQNGMIPAWRVGKSWRYLKSEIMKHFEKRDA